MLRVVRYIPTSLLILTTAILFFGTGCKKYLEEKSNNSLVVPTALSELQALLDDATLMNVQRTPSYASISDDDNFILDATLNSRTDREQALYKWIPYENYSFPNDWSNNYTPVYNANYCLEKISEVEKNSSNAALWNNVKGSALFYRAYYFTQLVWTFSKAYDVSTSGIDLGIPLRLTSDFNVPSERASVKDSYERIIADAKEAAIYLPDVPQHSYRPSKSGTYGLLARVYLAMRMYDSAFKYSSLCLQISNYLMNYNGDQYINSFNATSTASPFKSFNKEIIFYSEVNLLTGIVSTSTSRVDTVLFNSYTNNDKRKTAFFRPSGNYKIFKGNYTANTLRLFSGIATDEALLIRAECYARQGDKTSALNDLNTLLTKRYDPTFVLITAVDANDALNKILIERRKELLFRGLRFIDIKRLNKEGANITPKRLVNGQTYTLPPNDNRYALPLPLDVINASGMQQNPY